MAKRQSRGRSLDGILLLDKPLGISSNNALQSVKNIYFAQKAGHTGSLDPLATGMLPICFGEATKFSQFLLDADKEYQVTAKLGVRTTTCDTEGEVLERKEATHVTEENLQEALVKFRGEIEQIPSMFSALKYQGQPLYKLARKGIEVERKARPVTIYQLTLMNFNQKEATFSLDVKSSKGTYVRNLIDDIGQALACGAHVTRLHRSAVGKFKSEQMIKFDDLEQLRTAKEFTQLDDLILPLSYFATIMPTIKLTEAAAFRLRQGQTVKGCKSHPQGLLCLTSQGNFIGIGEMTTSGDLLGKRLLKQ